LNRRNRHTHIAALVVLLIAGMVTLTASCKKPPKPPEAPPQAEETKSAPAPAEKPPEQVTEGFTKPVPEPTETSEDLDSIIRQQNASRELLRTVHFEFDKSDIADDQVEILKANAAWIRSHPQYKILLEGHCDERDTIEYNLHLGERRASSVMQYLIDLGIPAERLRTISYGEERPVDPGHAEEAWAKNRRAEFTLEK
jgi:peptidoglycan-associated lipoprotein